MADITVTPADVELIDNVAGVKVQFGEAVTAGEAVYLNSGDNKYYLADASDSAKDAVAGVAISGGSADSYGYIVSTDGTTIDIGGTTAAGTIYVLSASAAGAIAPDTDLSTGDYVSVIGVGSGSNQIVLGINNSGIQHV